jgi:aspartate/methionine/tyrosine aminotransferase
VNQKSDVVSLISIGQGFPDWKSPQFVKDAMVAAVQTDFNQYARSAGEMNLVNAIAREYTTKIGREINALTEVTISVGATECLFAIMQVKMLNWPISQWPTLI